MNTPSLYHPVLALLLALSLTAAAAPAPSAAPDALRAIATASLSASSSARPYDERDWLQRFYAPRGYAAVWQEKSARHALDTLQAAAEHGLDPNEYGAASLMRQHAAGATGEARFDAALTRAMLHFLADLHVGRVRSDYHTALPDPRLRKFDPVEQLRAALAGDSLGAAVHAAQPAFPFYARVKETLAHYRMLANQPTAPLPPADTLRPGAAYPGAAQLRARLILLGDLAPGSAPADEAASYTPELVEAVQRFQLRHGLEADGVLGKDTMAALAVPLGQRVRQLELTLERLRWLPAFGPGRLIAVNLPAYRLWAMELGGPNPPVPLEMRVIVGESARTPTPLFIGQMRYLEFNPYWNVPRSITLGEIIPKLRRNPGYLAQHDMEIVGAGAVTSTVSDATLAALHAGKARIRQRPGPQNALGAVKFALPNAMNIYLHSTPQRGLFARNRRDLSHGCIRVEQPEQLAHFVLAGQDNWTIDSVAQAMQPGPTRRVDLAAPIPVVLFYATAMVDRDGRALFARDIYRRDPALEKLLAAHQD